MRIAVVPGDGIGREVVAQGLKLMEKIKGILNLNLTLEVFELGAERYLRTGEILPDNILTRLETYDAIYLGAIGDPRVKPGLLEKGILLKLRFHFDQYINLRPIKLLKDDFSPLKNKGVKEIDFTVIRENTEGIYTGSGGFFKKGTADEIAIQEMIATRKGVERIIKYAFNFTREDSKKNTLTLCDKSNVLTYAHDLWQRTFEELSKEYPQVKTDHYFIDAITMKMVRNPEIFDVIVTSNMFGDIITDLGAELQGGMGLAASGNINPAGVSMFEPVHGSAPDIAGKNIANPLAAFLAVGMLLKYLGQPQLSNLIDAALNVVLEENRITLDMGGDLSTDEVGDYVVKLVTSSL